MAITRSQAALLPVIKPRKNVRPTRKKRKRRPRPLQPERLQLVLPDNRVLDIPADMVNSFKRLCVLLLDMCELKQRQIYFRFSSHGHTEIMEYMLHYMKRTYMNFRKINILATNWAKERHSMFVHYHRINVAAG